MIKNYKKQIGISTLVILIPLAAGLLLWDQLPEQIPIHFDAHGTPNGWSGKLFAVVGFPLMMAAIHLFTCMIVLNDPKKQNIGNKMRNIVFMIIPVISCFSSFAIYAIALGHSVNVTDVMNILIGVMFLVFGNYMTKNHQNYTVGIRLPWTLHSEENWNKTHRFASKLWIAGGIIMIAGVFLNIEWLMVLVILILAFVPMIYSFILYKKGI